MTPHDKYHPGTPNAKETAMDESNTVLLPLVRLLARAAAKEIVAGSPGSSTNPKIGEINDKFK